MKIPTKVKFLYDVFFILQTLKLTENVVFKLKLNSQNIKQNVMTKIPVSY